MMFWTLSLSMPRIFPAPAIAARVSATPRRLSQLTTLLLRRRTPNRALQAWSPKPSLYLKLNSSPEGVHLGP
ncbi:hypothetical protein KC19_7G126600 [Ceratodon purpureus]|uniref:Uncharacterized protein n=1 Tax=Ceratodon purpureus TaxID=3225 RepID=A0A8T0H9F3_CERPU|nr:hypothetical protein KC19_7G126600 [Ceratodon purpureus]